MKELTDLIHDNSPRDRVRQIIEKPFPSNLQSSHVGVPLSKSPAAKYHHHRYTSGLAEHTVATTKLALRLADIAEEVYGAKANRDYVVAGSILHDLMKHLTFEEYSGGRYRISPLGERLDHATLMLLQAYEENLPVDLLHIILSQHGEKFSPLGPRTVEALIVSLADYADSQLNGQALRAAEYIARDCLGKDVGITSAKQAFDIIRAKQTKGCGGVRKLLG